MAKSDIIAVILMAFLFVMSLYCGITGAHASVVPSDIPMYQEPSWILYLGIMLLIGGVFSAWCSLYEDLEWEVTIAALVISIVMIIIGL